jgi:alkanesulfonate monooxygenase SsuD/methylene tetrahydromethanopterin reductase-like flavin-dependent oxidoreductase (luciferase family)
VLLVQQRDTIQTAKLVASIDQVSQGRFLFGVGGGWNQDEMANHGTVYKRRFKRVRESIEAMKEVWTKPKAEYHGEFVNFDPMMAWPKLSRSHIHLSLSEGLSRMAPDAPLGMATAGSRRPAATSSSRYRSFQKMARDAGRDPTSIEITSFGLAEDLDRLKRLRDLGVARVVPAFLPEKSDKVLPIIDR